MTPTPTDYAAIEPRRVLRCEADLDFIHCLRLDERRLSLKTFEPFRGANERIDAFLPEDEAKALIDAWTPHGIIYSSPLAGRLVHGAHLHPSLADLHLHGIGEYCLDLDDPWGLFARRHTKQMLTLSAAFGYYGLIPTDAYPATLTHKANRNAYQNLNRLFTVCQVRLPFPDSTLDDAHIRLYTRRPLLLGDAPSFEPLEGEALDAYYQGLSSRADCDGFPHLTIEGPGDVPAGGTVACHVQMTTNRGAALRHPGVDVYLEAHSGYLPRRKLTLDPATGRAPVSVTALGLEPGETLTLKAGFRYYTNAASLTLRVV